MPWQPNQAKCVKVGGTELVLSKCWLNLTHNITTTQHLSQEGIFHTAHTGLLIYLKISKYKKRYNINFLPALIP